MNSRPRGELKDLLRIKIGSPLYYTFTDLLHIFDSLSLNLFFPPPMATIAKNSSVSFAKPMLFIEAPKAKEAIEFYISAFEAVQLPSRVFNLKRKADQDSPLILLSELQIGSSTILITDYAYDDYGTPLMTPGNGFVMRLETESVHSSWSNAILSGAKPLKDEAAWFGDTPPYTEPMRQVIDPFGFIWMIYPKPIHNS